MHGLGAAFDRHTDRITYMGLVEESTLAGLSKAMACIGPKVIVTFATPKLQAAIVANFSMRKYHF